MKSRQAYYKITVNDKDITEKLKDSIEDLTYTDNASKDSDNISLTMNSIAKLEKFTKLKLEIITTNWKKEHDNNIFNCGFFLIDDINISGFPEKYEANAINAPINTEFLDGEVEKTWSKASFKTILNDIVKKYNLELVYDTSDNPILQTVTQSKKSDSSFIEELCEKYGFCMKIYNNKVVIYKECEYEKKSSKIKIKKTDVKSYSISDKTREANYSKIEVEYKTNSDSSKKYIYSTEKTGNTLISSVTAENLQEAILIAKSELRKSNREQIKIELQLIGMTDLVATDCVELEGFSNYDGKYFIEKIAHNFNSGYTIDISLHKVLEGDY